MRHFLALFFALAPSFIPASAHAWGFTGHRKLAGKLHEPLQGCLRGWLQTATANSAFRDDACDPDRWRDETTANYDVDEWPRHYLDIDYADPITSYPRDWAAIQVKFGQYADKNGKVPFRVEELYATLVGDFTAKNSAKAQQTIAWLSHYVTDSYSPFHCTRFSNPKLNDLDPGLHGRYESDIFSSSTRTDALGLAANQYLGTVGRVDPKNDTFDAIIVGHPLAQQISQIDFNVGGDVVQLYNGTADLTARRWGDAITVMGSLIVSAWVDANKPLLSGMASNCAQTAPQEPMVLIGYPLPVKADPEAVDAGSDVDAGMGGPGAEDPIPDPGCGGCEGTSAALVFPLMGLSLLTLRRRSVRV